jgi:hypothetical protein
MLSAQIAVALLTIATDAAVLVAHLVGLSSARGAVEEANRARSVLLITRNATQALRLLYHLRPQLRQNAQIAVAMLTTATDAAVLVANLVGLSSARGAVEEANRARSVLMITRNATQALRLPQAHIVILFMGSRPVDL